MVPFPNDNQHPVIYFPQPTQPWVGAEYHACGEWNQREPRTGAGSLD
jgi:hypothetical protein